MKIVCIGGGPAGLYFGILMKKQDARHDITIVERNKANDTFGWGVVFSDETLSIFEEADAESLVEIKKNFAYWTDIDTFYRGERIRSTGHGFCGLARVKLLNILQERAKALGCKLEFQREVDDLKAFADADLILACDGVNSKIRALYADKFKPSIDWRKCKFIWLGTDMKLDAFTFIFKENEHGLFQVHAYPFDANTSTFIVECHEDVWRAAGLDKADEATTVAYLGKLFKDDLRGHKLLTNMSVWRTFPNIRNEKWSHGNIVLVGDAAHTAHFSIGSGTKLAMEDVIALSHALHTREAKDIPAVLGIYEEARRPDVERLQKTAQTSLEWFENTRRYMKQPPLQLAFSLMTRGKSITYDNLRKRDPALVARVTQWFAQQAGTANAMAAGVVGNTGDAPPDVKAVSDRMRKVTPPAVSAVERPPIFTPLRVRGLTLHNRIVVSPMCQYSSEDGMPDDWHLVHLGSRAIGGAGLIIAEATHVSADARITPGCAGMYKPEHTAAWRRIVEFVHKHSAAKIGIQLAHAGRKGACDLPWKGGKPLTKDKAWPLIAASAIAYNEHSQTPREMTRDDIARVRDEFKRAAKAGANAGFDWLELHFAHGYLMSTFISALTNKRTDAYGGSLDNRLRFALETVRAVREVWPADKPLSVRISATEWAEGGLNNGERAVTAQQLIAAGADMIDVSAGGVVSYQKPVYGRMFQLPFSDQIRNEAGVPTMTVGNVQDADQCNTILAAGRADLCVLARAHLADPYLTLHAAQHYGFDDQPWPNQYLAAKPLRKKG
ncbi:MAG: bifunctional salicylyl-CoA 5-hydroxylase/oxidoreductase [Planctomycetes bacterium]|nr:bifunctional salicylyl-CoA 5-hydroxylase/oxidoreductase [Planctomycetota bacterium]